MQDVIKSVTFQVGDHFGAWCPRCSCSSHRVGNDMTLDEVVCTSVFMLYERKRYRDKICFYNGNTYQNSFKASVGWLWWFLKWRCITKRRKLSEVLSAPTKEIEPFQEKVLDCGQRAAPLSGFGDIITVSYRNLNATCINTLQYMIMQIMMFFIKNIF